MAGSVRRTLAVALVASAADAEAQVRATVTGAVYDSVARAPIRGAAVQLVAVDSMAGLVRSVTSDSLGRFVFDSVSAGSHILGFSHPILDSLGLESIVRKVEVGDARTVVADLAVPSIARIRRTVCGPRLGDGGLILGVVRDAHTGLGVSGAVVTAHWIEIEISATGIVTERHRVADTTHINGWYALCDVPNPAAMHLVAHGGADSTDRIEVTMPEGGDGFLRRDLFIAAVGEATTHSLSGTVVTADGARPIADARVNVTGVEVQANERGEWTLPNARAGTRVLEARAVGYVPEQRAIDVVAGAPPARVALYTIAAMLDTIRVTAARLSANMRGFESRRRGGMGRFMTAEQIAQRRPVVASDLLRTMGSVLVEQAAVGPKEIVMRHTFGERCRPSIYLNGAYLGPLTAGDFDAFIQPAEMIGVEVYRAPFVPGEFSLAGGSGCGAIVVWTARGLGTSRVHGSWIRRVGVGVAIIALAVGIGSLLR